MSFDLDAYFERIRLAERPACDLDGLAMVQRAHRLAIPFENLDIRLGRGIAIDSDSVFAKLVTRRRGGYCFEQNRLFCDALTALGFAVRPLLGRVWFGATVTPGRTHMLLLVTIDGRDWIADAGFGGSYSPIMPLVEDAEATGAKVFQAGTARKQGKLVASGGRVLNVTAVGRSVAEAQQRAYEAVDEIDFPTGFCRRDIGWRELARSKAKV